MNSSLYLYFLNEFTTEDHGKKYTDKFRNLTDLKNI
jgi:hypothetical protein